MPQSLSYTGNWCALWKNDFAWYGSNGRNKLDFSKMSFYPRKYHPQTFSYVRCWQAWWWLCGANSWGETPKLTYYGSHSPKSITFWSVDVVWRPVFINTFRSTWSIVEVFLHRFPDMEFLPETRLCPISCKFSKTDFSSTESGLLRPNWSGNH